MKKVCQEKASAESEGDLSNKFPVSFAGDFFVDFLGPFPWKKQEETIHPKIHSKIQIRIWELHSQNPHCKDLALKICMSGQESMVLCLLWRAMAFRLLRLSAPHRCNANYSDACTSQIHASQLILGTGRPNCRGSSCAR